VRREAPLAHDFPVIYVEQAWVCFVEENNLCKVIDHGLVEVLLLSDASNSAEWNNLEDWRKETDLSAIRGAYGTWNSLFVLFWSKKGQEIGAKLPNVLFF